MSEKLRRKPIKHFFIMDRVQKVFISRVLVLFSLISILTLLLVVGVYYIKYRSGYFYYMSESVNSDLVRHNIWSLIFPSAIPALAVSLVLGFFFALYASRKVALPLYKIRQWAASIFSGDLDYHVTVRKSDDLFELETSCKQVSRRYHEILQEIKSTIEASEQSSEEKITSLKNYLTQFRSL